MSEDRLLRVVFSKSNTGEEFEEVARGTWALGQDPEIEGQAIPPEVLKGLEVQAPVCTQQKGLVTFDRVDVRYAMDFEAVSPLPDGPSVCDELV